MKTNKTIVSSLIAAAVLAACSSNSSYFSSFPTTPAPNAQPAATLGTGQVKAALILPISAPGNAGIAGQAMRNAADMALAELNAPNIQLLVKDDAGSPDGARQAAQQALAEGAEIILGPLFAFQATAVYPLCTRGADELGIGHGVVNGIMNLAWSGGLIVGQIGGGVLAQTVSDEAAYAAAGIVIAGLLVVTVTCGNRRPLALSV